MITFSRLRSLGVLGRSAELDGQVQADLETGTVSSGFWPYAT